LHGLQRTRYVDWLCDWFHTSLDHLWDRDSVMSNELLQYVLSSNWLHVPRGLYRFLSPIDALVLAQLLHKANKIHAETKYGGWFWYTTKDLEIDLGFSRRQQTDSLARLRKKGLIDLKMTGTGQKKKRSIRINWNRLIPALDKSVKEFKKLNAKRTKKDD
jgi:hypothetical protein